MVNAATDFHKRMKRVTCQHARLEHGYVSVVGKDGLIVMKPKRKAGGLPIKTLAMLILGFFAFKLLLINHLGPLGYENRVDQLRAGTAIEQAGASILAIDPITAYIAENVLKIDI